MPVSITRLKEKNKIKTSKKLITKLIWDKQVARAIKGSGFKTAKAALNNL